MKARYDYIIAGAGCAGLSLAMQIMRTPELSEKNILIIDKDKKSKNDRTWCFWEKTEGMFESIVHKKWDQICITNDHFYSRFPILPYQYKMIRSIDYYNFCLESIKRHPNFELVYAPVSHMFSSPDSTGVIVDGEWIEAEYVFNSLPPLKPELSSKEYWLWQHFKGWLVQTPSPRFDDSVATLMDFRVEANDGTAFCYCLPFTTTIALIEYTLFSHNLAEPSMYDKCLQDYINNILGIHDFEILEVEKGIIPMTNYSFELSQNNIINIGTTGGQTKGSTGYTFNFIQKHSRNIVEKLVQNKKPVLQPSKRFRFYDSILLRVLDKSEYPAELIFQKLFSGNNIQSVFRFLDNESSVKEDIKIISSLPFQPFLKAASRHLF